MTSLLNSFSARLTTSIISCKSSPYSEGFYSVDIFQYILVFQEYCVLTESRILLKPVLGV